MFANVLSGIAGAAADTGSKACIVVFIDEPECPQSLLK
jgi:cyclic lactone autoinducer peptide